MEMLPATGWAEVATKTDVAALGNEPRAEMTVLEAKLVASMERSLRTQLMWTVTTMIAGLGGIAAVIALTS